MWAGIKVLLVDEHDVRREATKYVLEKERYQVTGVNNCAEARTLFWQDFDLLIIDFDLHQRNEGRLAQAWRDLRPATPVLLSCSPRRSNVDKAMATTPRGLSIEGLLSVVEELMGLAPSMTPPQS